MNNVSQDEVSRIVKCFDEEDVDELFGRFVWSKPRGRYDSNTVEYDSEHDTLHIWSGLGSDDYWYELKNVSKIPHNELEILAKHLAPKEENDGR